LFNGLLSFLLLFASSPLVPLTGLVATVFAFASFTKTAFVV